MMSLTEALVSSTIVLGSTGTVVSGAAVVLWKTRRGERLPQWFRVAGATLAGLSFIYAVMCLISASHVYERGPLISQRTFIIGFVVILAVTLVWGGVTLVLVDGRWPPNHTIVSVTESAAGIEATYCMFLVLMMEQLNFWVAAAITLVLLALVGGLVHSGWIILVTPAVTISVLVLGWYWGLLVTDLRDYMLEETTFTKGIYFISGVIFVLPITTIATGVGLWLGSLWEQAHENREKLTF